MTKLIIWHSTNQTGCQYQSASEKTLTTKEETVVIVNRKNISKTTHPYTA
jgi:hypothetical protein